jgi:hypothetical protein
VADLEFLLWLEMRTKISAKSRLMIKTRSLIRAIAAAEAAGGLTLLILPRLFVQLLLGVDVTDSGVVINRLFGLALVSFGLACWPDRQVPNGRSGMNSIRVLLTYNGLATAYLGYLRTLGGYRGVALVPAILFHAVLTFLLIRFCSGKSGTTVTT